MIFLILILFALPAYGATFYVNSACSVNGNGTTNTCGSPNGAWSTLKNALQVADCAGMNNGDILEIQGDAVKDLTCQGAATHCYFEDNVNIEGACHDIIIQNAANEHVIFDGTIDIRTSYLTLPITWTAIGSGVYQCQPDGCAGAIGDKFAWRAWYDRGVGAEELTVIQSNQVCDTSLAAGFARITQATQRMCVHLSNNASPATTSYFRVPESNPILQAGTDSSDNITLRGNPTGTGSMTFQRSRFTGIEANSLSNSGWTIENTTWRYMLDRCIAFSDGSAPAVGNTIIRNNIIDHCGQEGIRMAGDTGAFLIEGNTITNTQKDPVFEKCTGVGTGCLSGFSDNGTAIRLVTTSGANGGIVRQNTILTVGGGKQGSNRGINLEHDNSNVIIERNYIAHMSNVAIRGSAIMFSGSFANSFNTGIVVRNNVIYDVDVCFHWEYGGSYPSQVGTMNYLLNNTCVAPDQYGVLATWSDTAKLDGTVLVQNNIFHGGTEAPTLMVSVPSTNSTGWTTLQNNAFECDSCVTNQDIINWKGTTFERNEDCTLGVDCITNMKTILGCNFNGNRYGNILVDTAGSEPSCNISSGSIAINAGRSLGLVTNDYLGTGRFLGTAPDIGAYEKE